MKLYIEVIDEVKQAYEIINNGKEKTVVCLKCGIERIFKAKKSYNFLNDKEEIEQYFKNKSFFEKEYFCETNPKHEIMEYFVYKENKLYKVGEYPFNPKCEEKKSEFLINNEYYELEKAKELNNVGYGIASYVYLRRIIENYIKSILKFIENYIKDIMLLKEVKEKKDSKDRISLLKDYVLKDFLDCRNQILDIINNGIHNESDEYCLKNFDMLYNFLEESLKESEKIFKKKKLEKNIENMKKGHNEVKNGI